MSSLPFRSFDRTQGMQICNNRTSIVGTHAKLRHRRPQPLTSAPFPRRQQADQIRLAAWRCPGKTRRPYRPVRLPDSLVAARVARLPAIQNGPSPQCSCEACGIVHKPQDPRRNISREQRAARRLWFVPYQTAETYSLVSARFHATRFRSIRRSRPAAKAQQALRNRLNPNVNIFEQTKLCGV
jgi:hypothetical protein